MYGDPRIYRPGNVKIIKSNKNPNILVNEKTSENLDIETKKVQRSFKVGSGEDSEAESRFNSDYGSISEFSDDEGLDVDSFLKAKSVSTVKELCANQPPSLNHISRPIALKFSDKTFKSISKSIKIEYETRTQELVNYDSPMDYLNPKNNNESNSGIDRNNNSSSDYFKSKLNSYRRKFALSFYTANIKKVSIGSNKNLYPQGEQNGNTNKETGMLRFKYIDSKFNPSETKQQ
ncbi:hypothetical protein AYI69_g9639 [Smittium culicis]|uniref:Uncharacterized protein n=1 Tax=Smittium culicis TaxID=133412 RepID=A0A1R1XBB4_9FUNG|nr:hypothetical protein AYI69_g9639 [Smittium culicis]